MGCVDGVGGRELVLQLKSDAGTPGAEGIASIYVWSVIWTLAIDVDVDMAIEAKPSGGGSKR